MFGFGKKIEIDFQEVLQNKNLQLLFKLFGKHSDKLYLVGGASRNLLLGHMINEYDLAIKLRPHKVKKILTDLMNAFPEHFELDTSGKQFGCYKLIIRGEQFEITSFRTDKYKSNKSIPRICFTK